jgi:hypothetical protein
MFVNVKYSLIKVAKSKMCKYQRIFRIVDSKYKEGVRNIEKGICKLNDGKLAPAVSTKKA